MRTKTGKLLMKQQSQIPDKNQIIGVPLLQSVQIQSSPVRLQRRPTHISHVNDYNLVCVVNKRREDGAGQSYRMLQMQNLRLIEQNMHLVQWIHTLIQSLRQGILKSIAAIQDFRYLQGVNDLYAILATMTDYQQNGFGLPKMSSIETEKKHFHSYSTNSIHLVQKYDEARTQICRQVHSYNFIPDISEKQFRKPQKPLDKKIQRQYWEQQETNLKSVYSLQNEEFLRLILAQTVALQLKIKQKQF